MPTDPESMAATLDATGDYRVLRRLNARIRWHEPDGSALLTGVVADVETTGLDSDRDAIIQFCGIPFSFDSATGRIFEVMPALVGYDDPGRPIPPLITRLTGIQDKDVAGQRLDEAGIGALIAGAALVITHNAGFDRPFLEARMPAVFRRKPFACSIEEIPWKEYGFTSRGLEFLLYQRHRLFYDAHSAEADCRAVLHALAEPFDDGRLPLALLLESARQRTARIWAIGSPIEQKDLLKQRGYRFHGGGNGRAKSWYCDRIDGAESEAELVWLRETVYGGREGWTIEKLDARTRYSRR